MSDADDFFGGGNPSAKFPTVGTMVEGKITRVGEKVQQRDFTTGKPKTYDNGDPMWQLPIDVQTEQRDPAIPGDNGVRTVWFRGQMQKAFRSELRTVGAPGPRVGGFLRVTYVGDDAPEGGRGLPAKRYEVRYAPPAPSDSFFAGNQPAPAATPPAPAASSFPAQGADPFAQPVGAGAPFAASDGKPPF